MPTSARRIKAPYDPRIEANPGTEDLSHLAGLGLLAASLAHEVRGPSTALGLLIPELMAEIDALPARVRADLAPILSDMATCTQHLVKLSSKVGDATRCDDASEFFDISEVVADAVTIARVHARGLRLRVVESYEPAMVTGFRSQMTQSILNLMLNAIEACRSLEDKAHRIEVTVDFTLDTVVVTITDSGPGLADGVSARAFDRFFTTRSRQVGLGLALAQKSIEAHQGRIELRQDVRGGTTAIVTLPRSEAPEPKSSPWPDG
jgi:signal transduction histidine kinase